MDLWTVYWCLTEVIWPAVPQTDGRVFFKWSTKILWSDFLSDISFFQLIYACTHLNVSLFAHMRKEMLGWKLLLRLLHTNSLIADTRPSSQLLHTLVARIRSWVLLLAAPLPSSPGIDQKPASQGVKAAQLLNQENKKKTNPKGRLHCPHLGKVFQVLCIVWKISLFR